MWIKLATMFCLTLAEVGIVDSSLLARAQTSVSNSEQQAETEWARLNTEVESAYRNGHYSEGIKAAEAALALAEVKFGAQHAGTLISLNNLGLLYQKQGLYRKAETFYLRALEGITLLAGEDHKDTLSAMNNLAGLYLDQGNAAKAEPLLVRALQLRDRLFGEDDPDTLSSVNNLAYLYEHQGRLVEAEPLYLRALQSLTLVSGVEHPNTLTAVDNLAGLYKSQGRYAEAEPLYQRALEVKERLLGAEHPSTLTSVSNLAALYISQGLYAKAEPLHLRALEAKERVLGLEHPSTLTSLSNLAALYKSQGLYAKAEPLHLRALKARERVQGPEHPSTLISMNNVAILFLEQSRFGEAETLGVKVSALRSRVLGEEHPDTLLSLNLLGVLYQEQGRFSEAESVFIRVLDTRTRSLGEQHPNTLNSLYNLAALYKAQGRLEEAEPLYARAVKAYTLTLGEGHPDTLRAINGIAGIYTSRGEYTKAQPLSLQVFESRDKVLGPEHPDTLRSANDLATLYHVRGEYAEAEPLYLRVLTSGRQILGSDHIELALYYGNYANLLNDAFDLPSAAIFYEKHAANIVRDTEQNFGLSQNTIRASFRKLKAVYTVVLQQRLISALRLSEAELVGRLRKFTILNSTERQLPFTPLERHWKSRLGNTEKAMVVALDEIQASHISWREEVAALPAETLAADAASFGTSLQDDAIAQLAALGLDVAMLQITSLEEETHFFLLSPSGKFQHTSIPIGEEAIAEAIVTARDQLGLFEPSRSSRAGGPVDSGASAVSEAELQASLAALHEMLVAPVSDMLDAAGTQTLILNLQGRLRYAPFAALYDETREEYLTERFRLSRFTWGELDYDTPGAFTRAVGFGASQAFGEFSALPGVTQELDAILTGTDGVGVLDGTAALDASFTKAALEDALIDPPAIVHIASHFDMRPDDSGNSALLLGDGTRLTLKEITATPELNFEGVELLVLSACSTARSTEGTGLEVEGLAALAQLRGAEAVMATLWNVADASTAEFMEDFYTRLTSSGVSKSEALRQAQIKMINSDEYSHPYYWAPYMLMGNWR